MKSTAESEEAAVARRVAVEAARVDALITTPGTTQMAVVKLTTLLSRMRAMGVLDSPAPDEVRDYRLVQSALDDLVRIGGANMALPKGIDLDDMNDLEPLPVDLLDVLQRLVGELHFLSGMLPHIYDHDSQNWRLGENGRAGLYGIVDRMAVTAAEALDRGRAALSLSIKEKGEPS